MAERTTSPSAPPIHEHGCLPYDIPRGGWHLYAKHARIHQTRNSDMSDVSLHCCRILTRLILRYSGFPMTSRWKTTYVGPPTSLSLSLHPSLDHICCPKLAFLRKSQQKKSSTPIFSFVALNRHSPERAQIKPGQAERVHGASTRQSTYLHGLWASLECECDPNPEPTSLDFHSKFYFELHGEGFVLAIGLAFRSGP